MTSSQSSVVRKIIRLSGSGCDVKRLGSPKGEAFSLVWMVYIVFPFCPSCGLLFSLDTLTLAASCGISQGLSKVACNIRQGEAGAYNQRDDLDTDQEGEGNRHCVSVLPVVRAVVFVGHPHSSGIWSEK